MNNRYPKIVANRVDNKLPFSGGICPFCGVKKRSRELDHSMTLVGTMGKPKHEYADGNHHWVTMECQKCGKQWMKEVRYEVIWYTDLETRKVLRGVPNCFEDYVLTCSYCGGDVHRRYSELDGKTPVSGLYEGVKKIKGREYWVKGYREFYYCEGCSREEELKHKKVPYGGAKKLKTKWKIEVTQDLKVCCDQGISDALTDILVEEAKKEPNIRIKYYGENEDN